MQDMLHLNYKQGMTVVTGLVKSVMFGALINVCSIISGIEYLFVGEGKWDGHLTLCAMS
jgi:hypothetical protein